MNDEEHIASLEQQVKHLRIQVKIMQAQLEMRLPSATSPAAIAAMDSVFMEANYKVRSEIEAAKFGWEAARRMLIKSQE